MTFGISDFGLQNTSGAQGSRVSPFQNENRRMAETVPGGRRTFQDILAERRTRQCPYADLAENGVISYKNCTFVCDYENNRLTLGDMSDSTKCLYVNLPSGGILAVNKSEVDNLWGAIDMFSPQDRLAIMKVIMTYKMAKEKGDALEEDKNSVGESAEERIEDEANQRIEDEANRERSDETCGYLTAY